MLPNKPPRITPTKKLDLGKIATEIPEVEQDQFYDEVEAIKARNERIRVNQVNKDAGIELKEEYHEQMPMDKTKLKNKPAIVKVEWTPYD